MTTYAKALILQGEVKQISPKSFQVGEHFVKFQLKKGRTIITCDCYNSSYFAHNQICVHKCASIIFLANKDLNKRLNETIKIYEQFKKLNRELPIETFISELKELRRIK